jgi:release factor glutamine methyltransferase
VAADVGTGSGAIALALASEGRFERVIATEVSSDALAVARANALHLVASLRAPLEFRLGASLSPLVGECVDVLVCNPPYIAFEETKDLPTAVRDWEPAQALVCGGNGLAVTREVVRRAPECLRAGGFLAVEVDARRASKVAEMFAACDAFVDARIRRDLAGRERFVTATRK